MTFACPTEIVLLMLLELAPDLTVKVIDWAPAAA
jgi:hypothetical protein